MKPPAKCPMCLSLGFADIRVYCDGDGKCAMPEACESAWTALAEMAAKARAFDREDDDSGRERSESRAALLAEERARGGLT